MEVVVINRKLAKKETEELLRKVGDNNIKLYSNAELPDVLKKFSEGKIEITPEEKKQINYDIFKEILNFGDRKIEQKTITVHLSIERASIWHYNKFRIYYLIRNLYYDIKLINNLSESYNYISIYTNQGLLNDFFFDKPNIKIFSPKMNFKKTNKLLLIKYLFYFLLRTLLSFGQIKRLQSKSHIVIDHSIKQTCLNINTLKPELGNYNLQYLFDKLDKSFIIIEDNEIPKLKGKSNFAIDLKNLIVKDKNRFFGEYVLFKAIFNSSVRKKTDISYHQVLKIINTLSETITDPLGKLVIRYLISFNQTNKLFIFKYFAYQHFFSKHRFKTISTIDENSPRIKSILDAAKINSIKTIGIQHGTIHELHPAYMFTKYDREKQIMPDYTMVWGEYWKNLLITKGNYPIQSLFITGQIRTDIIPTFLSNKKIIEKKNMPKEKKIIVFASQPQRDEKLRRQAAFDVFSSISKLPYAFLIIKLHPAEIYDFDYYHNIAKEAKCKNYQIIYNIDLYLLISTSDILITCFSTVGAETVFFKKPLIILDHLKQDIQNYKKEGIAFQATNEPTLTNLIKNILSGKIKINKKAYTSYILRYAYKIDGKASKRTLNFISEVNNSQNHL